MCRLDQARFTIILVAFRGWLLMGGLALGGWFMGEGVVQAAAAGGAVADPFCRVTNGPAGVIPVQPGGTRRMIQRLEAIDRSADPSQNGFLSDGIAAMIRSALAGVTNERQEASMRQGPLNTLLPAMSHIMSGTLR
jgi:hypothetical protein